MSTNNWVSEKAGQTSVDQWAPNRSGEGQLRFTDLATHLTPELDRCPYCGNGDEEVIRHVLENHPDVVLDRLDELVDSPREEMYQVETNAPLLPPPDDDDGPSTEDLEASADGPPKCRCGNVVSRSYLRVFSDDQDNETLQHCYACRSRSDRY